MYDKLDSFATCSHNALDSSCRRVYTERSEVPIGMTTDFANEGGAVSKVKILYHKGHKGFSQRTQSIVKQCIIFVSFVWTSCSLWLKRLMRHPPLLKRTLSFRLRGTKQEKSHPLNTVINISPICHTPRPLDISRHCEEVSEHFDMLNVSRSRTKPEAIQSKGCAMCVTRNP